MSQREGDPKNRPSPSPTRPFGPAEDDPTNLITSEDIPASHRSLGEDPTNLAEGSLSLSGLVLDPSGTGLVIAPEPPGLMNENSATAIVIAPEASRDSNTALLVFRSGTGETSETDNMPAQQQQALAESEKRQARRDFSMTTDMPDGQRQQLTAVERRLASAEPKTLPLGTPVPNFDRTVIRSRPLGSDATAVIQAPLGHNEPSLGAKLTQANEVAGDQTEMRPVFASFAGNDSRKRRSETSRPGTDAQSSILNSPKFWIAALSLSLVSLGGYLTHVYYAQRQRGESLTVSSRSAVAQAHQRGRLLDFLAAQTELKALLDEQPSDGAALSARALISAEALYEFGGSAEFTAEAQGASRQSEGENRPAAVAAQLFVALSRAELKQAESVLGRLNALPASVESAADLAPLPLGLRDYLKSQVLLIAGRDVEAIEALRDAVAKTKLPLWQRRLSSVLSRLGRDAEALPHLIDVEQRQPDLCGAQIDLALLRGRAGSGSVQRTALATLRTFIEPPRLGADPCGRAERARAALGSAELLLWSEPTARGEARTLLDKAQSLATPQNVVFADALTKARLRTGDLQRAEKLSRAALELVPSRRSTRLLLAQALVRRDQGSEALSVLEPLTAAAEAGKGTAASLDLEALLWRAQALLRLNDTLEAQKLGRRILSANGIPGAVRTDAQLLIAQVYLRLQEPAASRRALEPLMQKVTASASSAGDTSGTTPEQLLDAQVLWAQMLLALRPPEQQEARALLEAVVGRAPERVEARTMLGKLLREMSEWGQAEQQLAAAVRTDEHYTPARRELAALLMQRGDIAKAHALYRELVKEEQDADLFLASARAERLDGAAEQALTTLGAVKRGRGEVLTKYDEPLLIEKARALLALDRPGEAETLLRGPATDLVALRRPTLPALFLRAQVSGIVGPARGPALAAARALLGRLPAAWRSDVDVRLAETELLLAEDNRAAARLGLEALITSLQTVPPSSLGEEGSLRQRAERLLAQLPPGPPKPGKPHR